MGEFTSRTIARPFADRPAPLLPTACVNGPASDKYPQSEGRYGIVFSGTPHGTAAAITADASRVDLVHSQ
ncbi:hypothetical protein [Streptomyces sp. TE5632]